MLRGGGPRGGETSTSEIPSQICPRAIAVRAGQLEQAPRSPLLWLDADVLARCWPGNRVLTGLRVCKALRDTLRHHPAPAVVGGCDASRVLSSAGLLKRWFLTFGGGACVTLPFDHMFQLSDTANTRVVSLSENFDNFCAEFKEARRSGWQGPTQLTLTHKGSKYTVLTHAQTAAFGRCLLDVTCRGCLALSLTDYSLRRTLPYFCASGLSQVGQF
eukprot:1380599-Rhodomonas_salina.3